MTILPFGTKCLGVNARVLVPVGIWAPISFARRPSSLAKDVCHIVAVGPFNRLLYSRDTPVVGSRTALMASVRCSGKLWMAKMLAATEYLVDAFGGLDDGTRRLTRVVCC